MRKDEKISLGIRSKRVNKKKKKAVKQTGATTALYSTNPRLYLNGLIERESKTFGKRNEKFCGMGEKKKIIKIEIPKRENKRIVEENIWESRGEAALVVL